MSKILIITNGYPSKEKKYSAVFVKNQVAWLKNNNNFNFHLLVIKRSFTGLWGSTRKYLFCYIRFIKHLFCRYRALHLHFLSPLLVLPYLYKFFYPSTRILITMHGSDINQLENRFLITIYRWLISCIDEIICVGRSMDENVKNKLGREVDHYLCAGINTEAIHQTNNEYTQRDIDFLYVGSFYSIKGMDKLLKAIEIVANSAMNFVFIGSGNFHDEIEALKHRINLKVYNGLAQKKISEYYNRSKFFIFPSRSEGFGLSLAEAMYCGTPAIISNLEQLKYQVQDGENGYVCNENTAEQLAKLIIKAQNVDDKNWRIMSKNARENAAKYTIDNVGKTLLRLYQKTNK